jgi:hypothetical protein
LFPHDDAVVGTICHIYSIVGIKKNSIRISQLIEVVSKAFATRNGNSV